jgi:hypothetical protein
VAQRVEQYWRVRLVVRSMTRLPAARRPTPSQAVGALFDDEEGEPEQSLGRQDVGDGHLPVADMEMPAVFVVARYAGAHRGPTS